MLCAFVRFIGGWTNRVVVVGEDFADSAARRILASLAHGKTFHQYGSMQ
jgi:hypothetical protein